MSRKYYNTLIITTNIIYNNNCLNIAYTISLISDFNLSISTTYTSISTHTSIIIARTKIDAISRASKTTTNTTPKKGAKDKRPYNTIGKNKVSSITSKAPYKTTTSKGATTTTCKKYR